MRNYLNAMVLAAFATSAGADEQVLIDQSRQLVKSYAQRLQAELQKGLQREGPLLAIRRCHAVAPAISQQLNHDDWRVRRTALRVRNPLNHADSWERAVLQQFEQRRRQGEKIAALEYHEIVERDGDRYFRYMKAIPTQALCLTCHGEHIAGQLGDELRKLYPDDQATGFGLGDIRGAFTVSRQLD
ncbi:Tll0287-like domain-containing protein [Methylomarinum vadi]|uniref:Tll0287-like domain-containing protein n=1 Tax=Methylomarinum vadi TaxID=438855 RepID=UPI0004DF02A7|nr:DUF3365 domain-containing protein [Methylomarinum vadi]